MPSVDDYVTLYRDDIIDTRRWDGSSWVVQNEIIDGNLIVDGSVLGDSIAANAISADELSAGSISSNEIAANSITARHIVADRSIFANTLQLGTRTITFSNLDTNLLSDFGLSITTRLPVSSNIVTGAYVRVPRQQTISFTRDAAIDVESIKVSMFSNLFIQTERRFIAAARNQPDATYSFNAGAKIKIGRTFSTAASPPPALTNLRPQIYNNRDSYTSSQGARSTGNRMQRGAIKEYKVDRPSNTLPLSLSPMNIQNQIFIEYYFNQSPATLSYDKVFVVFELGIVIQETRPFG